MQRTFSISSSKSDVTCVPRPGPKRFELKAGDPDNGIDGFYINFLGYTGDSISKTTLTYEAKPRSPVFSVGLEGPNQGYQFSYFQHLRSDTSEVIPSVCDFTLERAEKENSDQHFKGSLACSMLWADAASDGFDGTQNLNNYVDLVATFACDFGL
jgi:hypothetical protein